MNAFEGDPSVTAQQIGVHAQTDQPDYYQDLLRIAKEHEELNTLRAGADFKICQAPISRNTLSGLKLLMDSVFRFVLGSFVSVAA